MRSRVRNLSEPSRGGDSARDTTTLHMRTTARSAARQACIGDMEEQLHRAFAMARVPGGTDFVYERDHEAYAILDAFCSWDHMSEAAAPLVIFGPSGSGKSALLSNWLLHYRRRLEQRPQHGGPSEEPFVFCHAVGCTRHGVDVEQLLWRLLGDLKQRFDLGRNVPNEAERLSWELPRFLELAGRKGRVIIVIDGLHRVQDKKGSEIGLQWLPLRFPGNVRVIVTATNPEASYLQLHEQKIQQHLTNPHQPPARQTGSDNAGGSTDDGRAAARETGEAEYESSHRRRKVLMELRRRKWPTLEVSSLEIWRKRDVVEAFLKCSLTGRYSAANARSSKIGNGSRGTWTETKKSATFLTGVDFVIEEGAPEGLWSLSDGGGAQGGDHAQMPGGKFTVWGEPGLMLFPSMIEKIVSSDATNSALYLRTLLRALDWAATNAYDVRALLDKSLEAASIGALYNIVLDTFEAGNHPTEASKWAAQHATKADGGICALRNAIDALAGLERSDGSSRHGAEYLNGDHAAGKKSTHGKDATISEEYNDQTGGHGQGTGSVGTAEAVGSTSAEGGSGSIVATNKGDKLDQEDADAGARNNQDDGGDGDDGYSDEEYEDYEDEFDNDEDDGVDSEGGGGSPRSRSRGNQVKRPKTNSTERNSKRGQNNDDSHEKKRSNEGMGIGDEARPEHKDGTGFDPSCGDGGHGASDEEKETGTTRNELTVGIPAEIGSDQDREACDFTEVPVYFLGGAEVEGFGVTVGRAVALLHVVRHGLRCEELWSLLSALKASTSAQQKAEGTDGEAESRLLKKLLKNQNRLIDSIRTMDVDRDGVISIDEFRTAVESMDVGLSESQIERLIRSIDVDNDGELDMQEMVERFSTTARKMKRAVGGRTQGQSQSTGKGEMESSLWTEETDEATGEVSALSEHVRTSLRSALSVLGVNHMGAGEERSIFVLGLESEDLREVVFRRYVSSASTWHSRLVRFFQAQAPSPRRCEELPWHLNKCYRWHPLKNALVDLRTFETMWTTTQLRRELMDYWKLLTEGPLHANEEAAAADLRNDNNNRLLSLMIQESCNRGIAGTASVSAADIIAVGSSNSVSTSGKVAPFDLVFEYNHAVEGWQAFSHPTISRLGEMVHTIGDFMREMSQLLQKEYASPPFLHMPLDFKDLEGVGINPELIALTSEETAVAGAGDSVIEENTRNKDAMLSNPKGAPKDKLSHYRVAPFYYFQRWLWVQFPWMALSRSGAFTILSTGGGGKPAAGAAGAARSRGDSGGPVADKTRRFWRVKRIDPFGDPSVNVSDDRLKSRLKAELGRSATTTLLDTRSHANLLDDVGAGMMSMASTRRHALRAEAQESFGKEVTTKPPRRVHSTSSTGSLPTERSVAPKGPGGGGRGGFLSEEDSDWSLSLLAMPADLKTLGLGRESLLAVGGAGGGSAGHDGTRGGRGSGATDSVASRGRPDRGRTRKRRRNKQIRTGLRDVRKDVSTLVGTNPLSPLPGKALVEVESFLASSTSIFPMTIDEEMVIEAKDMTLKLRQIHDALEGEVRRKRQKLADIKRDVEERNSQDAHTMSRTMAGENMIQALDARLTKVRSTATELERIGGFYNRIIELCVTNPPKDNRHLRALEEQVFLSKQQTTDLAGKVQDLLLQKDAIERLGIDGLRAQLARVKAARQKVNARSEQLNEQIQKSRKSERRGLHQMDEDGHLPTLAMSKRGTPPKDRGHLGLPAVGMTALVVTAKAGKLGPAGTLRGSMADGDEEGEGIEESLEQLALLMGSEDVDGIEDKFKAIALREQDLENQGQIASNKVERLREDLEESRQALADLQVLEGDETESNPAATTPATSSKNANLHREQRRLDDLLFQSGIRLAQSTRKAEKAKGAFNDLRAGILHLAQLIDSVVRKDEDRGGLIPALFRVQRLKRAGRTSLPPPGAAAMASANVNASQAQEGSGGGEAGAGATAADTAIVPDSVRDHGKAKAQMVTREGEEPEESDPDAPVNREGSGLTELSSVDNEEGVCKLLKACEERIARVMGICGMGADNSTTTAVAPVKTSTDASEALQHDFWHSGLNATAISAGSGKVTEGPGTPSVLQRLFMGRTKGFQSDGAGMDVRVSPPKGRDLRFERSMGDVLRQQNETLEMEETEANNLDRNAVATGVASFLEDALNSKSANRHLRRANMLVMGKQGKRAGFGLVMDDVLSGADIDIYGLADATRRRANGLGEASRADGALLCRTDLSAAVRARTDLKASAHATLARRKQEDRKKALLRKRVDQSIRS